MPNVKSDIEYEGDSIMLIERFSVGPLDTNAYVIADEETKHAAIVDPGDIFLNISISINFVMVH